MKDGEKRILMVLWAHKDGLGVNELKKKTSKKVVEYHLNALYEQGYVDYNLNLERGKKRIVNISDKGKSELDIPMVFWKLNEEFMALHCKDVKDIKMFEQKLDLFQRAFIMVLEACLDIHPKYAVRLIDITKELEKKFFEEKLKPFYKYITSLENLTEKGHRDKGE